MAEAEAEAEAEESGSSTLTRLSLPLKILYQSFNILCYHPTIFFSITALSILPLSLLVFASASASHPLQIQISSKEALAQVGPTIFEARHVWQETRSDALILVRLRSLFFLPSYALSILAATTAVNSASLSLSGKRPTWQTALAAARLSWKRLLVTSFFVFVITCAYKNLARVARDSFSRVVLDPLALAVLELVEGVWRVYLEAVLSMGMVDSILEERYGLEALVEGWNLLVGRRFCGMVLGGLAVLWSGFVGWGFRVLMGGEMGGDSFMVFAWKAALIVSFCLVVLLSFLTHTVLYCYCRKYHGMKMEMEMEMEMVEDTP